MQANKRRGNPEMPPAEPYESNPGKVIMQGTDRLFSLNQKPALYIIGLLAIVTIFQYALNFWDTTESADSIERDMSASEVYVTLGVVFLFAIVSWLIGTVFWGVISYIAYKTSVGEHTTLKEALKAVYDKLGTIILTNLYAGLKIIGGFLLLIVPGIRASLRYQMVLFPVFADNARPIEAANKIKSLTKNHLLEIFGFTTLTQLVPVAGTLLLMGAQSISYQQLKALKAHNTPPPPIHWLNYLGFFLAGLVLLLIGFIFMILVLIALQAN